MTSVLGSKIFRGVLRRAGQGIMTTTSVAAGSAAEHIIPAAGAASAAGSSRCFPTGRAVATTGPGQHGSRSMSGIVPDDVDVEPRKISIGDVTLEVDPPRRPELVPLGYGVAEEESQDTLAHLRSASHPPPAYCLPFVPALAVQAALQALLSRQISQHS